MNSAHLFNSNGLAIWHGFPDIMHINALSPHDALKNHFTYLKNRFYFAKTKGFRKENINETFTKTWQFSKNFHPRQVIFIHYKSRIAAAIRGL